MSRRSERRSSPDRVTRRATSATSSPTTRLAAGFVGAYDDSPTTRGDGSAGCAATSCLAAICRRIALHRPGLDSSPLVNGGFAWAARRILGAVVVADQPSRPAGGCTSTRRRRSSRPSRRSDSPSATRRRSRCGTGCAVVRRGGCCATRPRSRPTSAVSCWSTPSTVRVVQHLVEDNPEQYASVDVDPLTALNSHDVRRQVPGTGRRGGQADRRGAAQDQADARSPHDHRSARRHRRRRSRSVLGRLRIGARPRDPRGAARPARRCTRQGVRTRRASVARSSTRPSTGSPTRSCSAASPGTSREHRGPTTAGAAVRGRRPCRR